MINEFGYSCTVLPFDGAHKKFMAPTDGAHELAGTTSRKVVSLDRSLGVFLKLNFSQHHKEITMCGHQTKNVLLAREPCRTSRRHHEWALSGAPLLEGLVPAQTVAPRPSVGEGRTESVRGACTGEVTGGQGSNVREGRGERKAKERRRRIGGRREGGGGTEGDGSG